MNVEIQIDMRFTCNECGADVVAEHHGLKKGFEEFGVLPCKICIEAAKEEGAKDAS